MNREQKELFKKEIRRWNFDRYSQMPIARAEAEWIIEIFDSMDRQRELHRKRYQENREELNALSKARYRKKKEEKKKELTDGKSSN